MDFPGGPVAKTLPFQCRSHMLCNAAKKRRKKKISFYWIYNDVCVSNFLFKLILIELMVAYDLKTLILPQNGMIIAKQKMK